MSSRNLDSILSRTMAHETHSAGPVDAIMPFQPRPTFQSHGDDAPYFLGLPWELRMQVYRLVYLDSPIRRPRLVPWYPIATCRTRVVRAITPERSAEKRTPAPGSPTSPQRYGPEEPGLFGLLSPHRPLCRIPTALQQTCRQIYEETWPVPFHDNEFVFINWFSSGLSSAIAFAQGRTTWQLGELRFMRLEIFAGDVIAGGGNFADWARLCCLLKGLRGLRLMVRVEGGGAYDHTPRQSSTTRQEQASELADLWELVRPSAGWVSRGLGLLRGLSQLEIELVDVRWTDEEKIEWCRLLKETLVACNAGADVRVVCVQRQD